MTKTALPLLLNQIERFLSELERSRISDSFANDVFEAASYWVDLGRWVLEGNTAVNFPARAANEAMLLNTLVNLLKNSPQDEQVRYAPLFEAAEKLLAIVSSTAPLEEGHLGFLKTVGELFQFVEDSYGFKVTNREPTLLRYSSGVVYLELECSKNTSISCSFGPESQEPEVFWIDDLLYMYGDVRYRTVPQTITLSRKDLEDWFGFVADVLRRYGQGVLSNEPGISERLQKAQADRDAEYTSEMDRKYGGGGQQ